MQRSILSTLAVTCVLAAAVAPAAAQQKAYNRSGVLSCQMAPTVGLIIGSRQNIDCQFRPDGGVPERTPAGVEQERTTLGELAQSGRAFDRRVGEAGTTAFAAVAI